MFKKTIFKTYRKMVRKDSDYEWNEIRRAESYSVIEQKYLKSLLLHCYNNVPYYRNIFDRVRLLENTAVNLNAFNNLPLLTKNHLRLQSQELISKDLHNGPKFYYNSSGGSTGEPVRLIQNIIYDKWMDATLRYYYEQMVGIDELAVKKVLLWGSERDVFEGTIGTKAKLFNFLRNAKFLNSFRMTSADMNRYTKTINSHKPDLIRGYAGSLYEFSLFIEREKISIHSPKVIVSAAETLTDIMRKKIENVFRTKVYNFYGSREVGPIAGECRCGLMHVFSFNNHVDILDVENKPSKEHQEGRLVVTGLHNWSMPLIRYEIGDMAIIGPKKCACGSQLPVLEKVTGRLIEHFVKRNGESVPGEFFIHLIGVVCNNNSIRKFKVVQEDYERIRIFIVASESIHNINKIDIIQKIKVVMGSNCEVTWEHVDEIPALKSGKYLYTQSLVNKA